LGEVFHLISEAFKGLAGISVSIIPLLAAVVLAKVVADVTFESFVIKHWERLRGKRAKGIVATRTLTRTQEVQVLRQKLKDTVETAGSNVETITQALINQQQKISVQQEEIARLKRELAAARAKKTSSPK